MKNNELMAAALEYARRGWAVFPLRPGRKEPATGHGFKDATTDEKQIREWWKRSPASNIGIATGPASGGLLVIDLDDKNGKNGPEELQKWEKEHDPLPATLRARTASGAGEHLYFTYSGMDLRSPQDIRPGIDLRAAGAYVVAPPSIYRGNCYTWENKTTPAAAIDGNVLKFIKEPAAIGADPDDDADDFDIPDTWTPYKVPDEIPQGCRTSALIALIGSLTATGVPRGAIEAAVRETNTEKCVPPLTETELKREVFPALTRWEPGPAKYMRSAAAVPPELIDKLSALNAAENYEQSDKGAGRLFSDVYADHVRYCPEWKKWAYYDGARWAPDLEGMETRQRGKQLSDALMMYAPRCGLEGDAAQQYRKYCAALGSQRRRETMLIDARDNNYFHADDLDRDPYIFNCKNGVLDLHDGRKFTEHEPGRLLGKLAGVEYDPDARAPQWYKFVNEIMEGNADKIEYLQRFAGLSLTGITREETMLILYGPSTRNGKSTFVETLRALMGNYAVTIEPETLAYKKRDSKNASPDIARLQGARLVISSEPPKGMLFDAAHLKAMTGRDTITARGLYENNKEFIPVYKLMMNTNYLPNINDDTLFSSGRINVVEFTRHFTEAEQDKRLKEKLLAPAELSGILNWALQGFEMYRREGLNPPEVVREAVAKYRKENDRLGNFITECLEPTPGGAITAKALYAAYRPWCIDAGCAPETKTHFISELRRRGYLVENAKIKGEHMRNVVLGYSLKPEYIE